jgi:hypothetical protein
MARSSRSSRRQVMGSGVSHAVLVAFDVVSLAIGGGIAGFGALLATRPAGSCMQELHAPLLALGALVGAVSVLAILASFFRISILLRAYIGILILLALAFLLLALLAFVATHRSAANAIASVSYKQFRVGDLSAWLRSRVTDPYRWSRIRACLRDSKLCAAASSSSSSSSPAIAASTRFLSRILRLIVANDLVSSFSV